MPRYKVIPTKTNLMKLRKELSFAQEGYELLDQKRQILVVELMNIVDKTTDLQEKVRKEISRAFNSLQKAVINMGRSNVNESATAVNIDYDISIKMRRIMGVNIPKVALEIDDKSPYFSLRGTSYRIDEAISDFKALMVDLSKLAELHISLMRIADEVRRTMRRVNALEKIAIPDYEESIKYIESTLEESERDTFAVLKIVKTRLEKKRG
ncbi:MAG: V-type ATP synthase subunit D [bacterium]